MPGTLDPSEICLKAMTWLAGHGIVAVLLLDENLVVQASHGRLADPVPRGVPIDEGMPHLAGLAPDLLNLQDEPEAVFALGNVGLAGPDGTEKLNIEAFWIAAERHYYVLLHKLGLKTEPEAEIVKQARARRIAEAHLQRARQDLASQTSLLAVLAERAPVALAIVGSNGGYELVTEAWRGLFGLPADLPAGTALDASPATAALADRLDRVFAGQSLAGRIALPIGGSPHDFAVRAVPTERNESRGAIITVSDLSGEAAEIDRLRARIESLEASNRALEEFAAAAHDLEAPRRAIDRALGSADLAGAAAASTRLHGMLADLMEHARAGATGGTPEDIDLSSFARETLAATAGGERFRLLCAGDTLVLRAPRVPLEIALRNLLANAVRHHDLATGTITLGLESDDKIWRLTVTDDGPGIPESERERIFEPFRRLSATPGGAGLGLSLVATAARRLGGAAEILNTRTSRGTTVLLTWPRQVG
ncbi:MAG: HAMP domain-containing sensor histidine kinase [Hyphomicrobiaceae bacterium]